MGAHGLSVLMLNQMAAKKKAAKKGAATAAKKQSSSEARAKKKGSWGGKRENAGRKPLDPNRLNVPHRARGPHDPKHPVHGSIRRAKGLPTLKSARVLDLFIRCAAAYSEDDDFHVLHVATDAEHLHVIVEAKTKDSLQLGMQSLAIRTARNLNILLSRKGEVWDDRFQHEPIASSKAMGEVLHKFFPASTGAIASPTTSIAQKGWSESTKK